VPLLSRRLPLARNAPLRAPLHSTDKGSEEAVLAVVRAAFPSHAVLGEEGGVSGDVSSEYLWCIDPLDGTTNFTHSYPSFAVSVAVTRAGVPVAAAVVEFTGGPRAWATRRYAAGAGLGAVCNGAPLRISNPATQLRRALLVTGFGYDHGADWLANMGLFQAFTDECQGVRRLGAASVDLCHVALGVLDGYWEYQLKPWDMAAGALILTEAGGEVTKGDGRPFSVFAKSIVATNGALHAAVLDKVCPATLALAAGGFDLEDWFIPKGYVVQR
jgi:myo-inositol-1(or 4)-monophosphatase